jgi:sialate O-acetylesterase
LFSGINRVGPVDPTCRLIWEVNMKMSRKSLGVFLAALCAAWTILAATPARAEVKLPALIGDNMVLQEGLKVPIWGWAAPGQAVTVSIAGQAVRATADKAGHWRVTLEPLKPGPALEMTVAGGGKTITVKNILVGEVWICGGQSNMTHPVALTGEADKAKYPEIRLFDVPPIPADAPVEDVKAAWAPCSPQTASQFSAIGYFFGRMIHKDLKVPVGLIHSALGATEAESWMDPKVLEADPQFKPIFKFWEGQRREHEGNVAGATARRAAWEKEAAKAKAEGKPLPPGPIPIPFDWSVRFPGRLYNGMIVPLIPYGIRGVIWYQGESNYVGALYRQEFAALIESWRKAWGQGDFPFLFVQLANYAEPWNFAVTRQAQLESLAVPHTGMAVTIDIGEAHNIHPGNKLEVGRRLGLIAEATVYGKKDVVYSGPICDGMKVEGNKVRLKFQHVDGGLVAKDGPALKGFAVAAADGKFVGAEARIDGETVVVSSDQVAVPVYVRYAWADNPECNLYNKAGLPASPFGMPTPPEKPAGQK